MKSDLPVEVRENLRRLAGDAIVAMNPRHGPFLEAVANPIQMLALLDMIDRAAKALQDERHGA